jgi:hypothetical protein
VDWSERILIPAAALALFVLVLPLSHAHAARENPRELTPVQAIHLQAAIEALRSHAGDGRARIGAVPAAVPAIDFFRAQHRMNNWELAGRYDAPEIFDYYVLSSEYAGWAEERHLIVVHRDADFLVARTAVAAM